MTRHAFTGRRRLAGAAIVLGAGFAVLPAGAGRAAPAPAAPQAEAAAHVVTVVPSESSSPSISADGRLVVYSGPPTIDDGRTSTVWMLDRGTGETTELTVPVADVRLGNSVHPMISQDGCKVAVVTEMPYDLFRDDDLGSRWDVYDRLLPACDGRPDDWELVSSVDDDVYGVRASDAADPTEAPELSGSGSVAAIVRLADPPPRSEAQEGRAAELITRPAAPSADATAGRTTVDIVDLTVPIGEPGRIRPVAGTPAATPDTTYRYRGIRQPSLSDDGRFVAFTSDAASDAAAPTWSGGPTPGGYATSQVFVWDREATPEAGAVQRIGAPVATPADAASAGAPAISGDGRYVAFEGTATGLVVDAVLPSCAIPANRCQNQIYRWDRTDGSVKLVSRVAGDPAAAPIGADSDATAPSISADGGEITFVTRATNLFDIDAASAAGSNGGTVALARPEAGTLERISVLPDGVSAAPAAQSSARLASGAGRAVVFETDAADAYLPVAGANDSEKGPEPATGRRVVIVQRNPQIVMADLDIGAVAVGYPSPEWFIGVINNGPGAFVPAAITTSNPNFGITGGTCTPDAVVQVGSSCEVHIILTPSAAGPLSGTLTVAEKGYGAVAATSQLIGFGGEPALSIAPSVASFADTDVGRSSEPITLQVSNIGFAPTNVAGVTVEGADPNDFRLTTSDCARVLQVGENCAVAVTFSPTQGGLRTASVSVSSDSGENASVLVSGTGSYTSELLASSDRVFTGASFGIGGNGFAPYTAVIIHWADGSGGAFVALTDRSGSFLMTAALSANERPGRRTLVAQSPSGQSAAVDVIVVPGFVVSPGLPGLGNWPAG